MAKGKFLKLFTSVFILLSISGCSFEFDYIFPEGFSFQKLIGSDVDVVDAVLCSGPADVIDSSTSNPFSSPNAISEIFYCAYFETSYPEYVAIIWFFEDEEYSFASSDLQLIKESGYYYYSLMDSIDYSDHFWNQYDGEFKLGNQISEGSFRIHVYNRQIVFHKDLFYFQMNP